MGNHYPNGIREHNDRHTLANEPGNHHTHEQPHPNDTQGAHTDRNTITPPGAGIFLLSRG